MHPKGICYQAFIPMRKEPGEASEMVSQVLFGEFFSILEELKSENFSRIRLDHDNYEGWINTRCIHYLSDKDWETLHQLPALVTHELVNFLQSADHDDKVVLGSGSLVRLSSPGKTKTGKLEYNIPFIPGDDSLKTRDRLLKYGISLLSVPYLWGGRSSFGFDCSGLCQNLYRQVGIEIPRDASVQSTIGRNISFIDEAKEGDLAFFDNGEGNIIHVGMFIGENKILHASGRVKIDSIDHQGIFSQEQNRYTHNLRLMKRLLD